jgi:hypothetical protein
MGRWTRGMRAYIRSGRGTFRCGSLVGELIVCWRVGIGPQTAGVMATEVGLVT